VDSWAAAATDVRKLIADAALGCEGPHFFSDGA
jgi:hypothetical protein